jgi:hypothetical protein
LIARHFGVFAMSAFSAGMQELEVNCAIPKIPPSHESALSPGFYRPAESASGRLEKPSKNPIYSIAC